jgi:hypothetical protein
MIKSEIKKDSHYQTYGSGSRSTRPRTAASVSGLVPTFNRGYKHGALV